MRAEEEIARQVGEGGEAEAARCGMLEVAGVSAGAAFVGAFARLPSWSAISYRLLHGGSSFSVVGVDLRHPGSVVRAVPDAAPGAPTPAFTLLPRWLIAGLFSLRPRLPGSAVASAWRPACGGPNGRPSPGSAPDWDASAGTANV